MLNGSPPRDTRVTIAAGRERIAARVDDAGPGWIECVLDVAPLRPLHNAPVFLEWTTGQGHCRLAGRSDGIPAARMGDCVRIALRSQTTVTRRSELVRAKVLLEVIVLRADRRDAVAARASTVALDGGGMQVRGLPFAPGERYDFDLQMRDGGGPVTGQFKVDRVDVSGVAQVTWTQLTASDRTRIVVYASSVGGRGRRAA